MQVAYSANRSLRLTPSTFFTNPRPFDCAITRVKRQKTWSPTIHNNTQQYTTIQTNTQQYTTIHNNKSIQIIVLCVHTVQHTRRRRHCRDTHDDDDLTWSIMRASLCCEVNAVPVLELVAYWGGVSSEHDFRDFCARPKRITKIILKFKITSNGIISLYQCEHQNYNTTPVPTCSMVVPEYAKFGGLSQNQ